MSHYSVYSESETQHEKGDNVAKKLPKQTWVAVDMFTGEIVTDGKVSRVLLRHREIVNGLASICKMLPPCGSNGQRDWGRMTKSERGILNRCAKELREASATDEQLNGFVSWWYRYDWRGAEKRQVPGPWDVVKNWSRYLNWAEGTEGGDVAIKTLHALGFETLEQFNEYAEARRLTRLGDTSTGENNER